MRNRERKAVRSSEFGVRSRSFASRVLNSTTFSIPRSAFRTPHSKGFTLIEVIVTLVVLSIAAVGILSVFTTGMKGSADPLIINQAISLAQGEMDVIMSVKKQVNGFTTLGTVVNGACTSTMLAGFTCARNIYFVNAGALNTSVGGPTDYKHVTVTITAPVVGDVVLDGLVTNY